jgi:hypothetical protein
MHDEIRPVFFVLAAPDQLRIEIAVTAFEGDARGMLVVLLDDRLELRGGDVLALVRVVGEGLDGLFGGVFLAMVFFL